MVPYGTWINAYTPYERGLGDIGFIIRNVALFSEAIDTASVYTGMVQVGLDRSLKLINEKLSIIYKRLQKQYFPI